MRIALALVVVVLFFARLISGIAAVILGIFAVIFLLTGLIGFCPAYAPFGISTRKK
jgi:hypothetical protein